MFGCIPLRQERHRIETLISIVRFLVYYFDSVRGGLRVVQGGPSDNETSFRIRVGSVFCFLALRCAQQVASLVSPVCLLFGDYTDAVVQVMRLRVTHVRHSKFVPEPRRN